MLADRTVRHGRPSCSSADVQAVDVKVQNEKIQAVSPCLFTAAITPQRGHTVTPLSHFAPTASAFLSLLPSNDGRGSRVGEVCYIPSRAAFASCAAHARRARPLRTMPEPRSRLLSTEPQQGTRSRSRSRQAPDSDGSSLRSAPPKPSGGPLLVLEGGSEAIAGRDITGRCLARPYDAPRSAPIPCGSSALPGLPSPSNSISPGIRRRRRGSFSRARHPLADPSVAHLLTNAAGRKPRRSLAAKLLSLTLAYICY